MTPVLTSEPVSMLAPGRPRILGGPAGTGFREHESRFGPLDPHRFASLVDEVDRAGLRGRGGAGFPTHIKMRAVIDNARRGVLRRTPVIVGNGTESEPASAKDTILLRVAPHLVLDGLEAAGAAVGARRAVLCIDRRDEEATESVRRALAERAGRDRTVVEIASAPSRYVAGEETALVSWINGGDSRPAYAPPRPVDRGVSGAPTLVDNVETLANVALIARFGGLAYRQVGEADEPGTMLVTLRGALRSPGVYETPIGSSLGDVIAGAGPARSCGVLVGGYFGTWLRPDEAASAALSRRGLSRFGASPGCGLIAVLPAAHCPLQEVSAVLAWLASNSAGQCGACTNGLPALSAAFDSLVAGDPGRDSDVLLDRWSPMVAGRGACKLPDGAVSFLSSARRVFAEHADQHRRLGRCPPNKERILPIPALDAWR